jgi:ribosomal protein S18 acetylase RimI-like enzyme
MTSIVPMTQTQFQRYLEAAIPLHAHDNVASGEWPAESAMEWARAEQEEALPQGMLTPGHFFYEIRDESDEVVGSVWFALVDRASYRSAHIYDVYIQPIHRRRGHAARALQLVESEIRALGVSNIGLHVFRHRTEAQALYQRLGYSTTGLNMHKKIDRD